MDHHKNDFSTTGDLRNYPLSSSVLLTCQRSNPLEKLDDGTMPTVQTNDESDRRGCGKRGLEFDRIRWSDLSRYSGSVVIDGYATSSIEDTDHRVYTIGIGHV